jgi:hypothetical protein
MLEWIAVWREIDGTRVQNASNLLPRLTLKLSRNGLRASES